jgi:uncharacterized membrane protein
LDGGNTGPNAINIHGDSVGNVYENNLMSAALWPANGTSLVELGSLDPALGATANAINAGGYTVGSASILDGGVTKSHAVMWVPGGTSAIDLNSLIDPSSGWVLNEARGINDAGLIVGTGSFDPDGAGPLPTLSLAFRLDPVPEPSGLGSIGAIVIAAGLRRRQPKTR